MMPIILEQTFRLNWKQQQEQQMLSKFQVLWSSLVKTRFNIVKHKLEYFNQKCILPAVFHDLQFIGENAET